MFVNFKVQFVHKKIKEQIITSKINMYSIVAKLERIKTYSACDLNS